jgi:hypothetical protein
MNAVFFWLYVLALVCLPPAAVLGAVGGILRLCESSWGKPPGAMGSRGLLRAAGVLCLPAILFIVTGFVVGAVR